MLVEIIVLLWAFQFKHLLADYYMQTPYHYENKGKAVGWIRPLFEHAYIHASWTGVIAVAYMLQTGKLEDGFLVAFVMLLDLTTHFVIDRWKATQGVGPDTKKFWTGLGIDQMLHHLVGITIIVVLVA